MFLDQLEELPVVPHEDEGKWKTPWYKEITKEYRHVRILHQDIKKFEFDIKALDKLAPPPEIKTMAELEALKKSKPTEKLPAPESSDKQNVAYQNKWDSQPEFKGFKLDPKQKKERRRKLAERRFLEGPKRQEKVILAAL